MRRPGEYALARDGQRWAWMSGWRGMHCLFWTTFDVSGSPASLGRRYNAFPAAC